MPHQQTPWQTPPGQTPPRSRHPPEADTPSLSRQPWVDKPWAETPLGRHPSGRCPGEEDTLTEKQTPPLKGNCSVQYTSYWNAFLFCRTFITDCKGRLYFWRSVCLSTRSLPPGWSLLPGGSAFRGLPGGGGGSVHPMPISSGGQCSVRYASY